MSFYTMYQESASYIDQMESQLRLSYDNAIKAQVEELVSSLDGIQKLVDSGNITAEAGKLLAANVIRNSRYGDGGYFWADTLEGTNVAMIGNLDIENINRIDLVDKEGNYLIQNFIDIANSTGEGFSNYYFPKAGQDVALPKRAFVKLYEPYGWVIGTGNYIDDIDAIIQTEKDKADERFKKNIISMSIIFLVAIAIGCVIALIIAKTITRPITEVTKLIDITSNLDITDNADYDKVLDYKDETGVMAAAVVKLRSSLREIIKTLKNESVILTTSSSDLKVIVTDGKEGITSVTHAVNEFADGAQEQANDAQVAVEKMHLLAQEIKEGVDRSESIASSVDKVNNKNKDGVLLVHKLNEKFEVTKKSTDELDQNVKELSERSAQIGDITSTIQSVAEQTNLLALNAAIEAARAGEAGRGFAVVADEIRKLAEQTSASTAEIEKIIGEITSEIRLTMENMALSKEAVEDSSNVVLDVQGSFDAIETSIDTTFVDLQSLISNIQNVDRDKEDALNAIQGISAITEENAASSEEISATMDTQNDLMAGIHTQSDQLNQVAVKLSDIVSKFRV